MLPGHRRRRCRTAASKNADDERQHGANGPEHEDARHRSLQFAVVSIGRELQDQKVARDRDCHVADGAVEQTDTETLQRCARFVRRARRLARAAAAGRSPSGVGSVRRSGDIADHGPAGDDPVGQHVRSQTGAVQEPLHYPCRREPG
jgi:hypothetical protein